MNISILFLRILHLLLLLFKKLINIIHLKIKVKGNKNSKYFYILIKFFLILLNKSKCMLIKFNENF